jgi:hypothetical protein
MLDGLVSTHPPVCANEQPIRYPLFFFCVKLDCEIARVNAPQTGKSQKNNEILRNSRKAGKPLNFGLKWSDF